MRKPSLVEKHLTVQNVTRLSPRLKIRTILQKLLLWYRCTCARAPVPHPFLYLWTYCAETWCVFRGPLAMRFTQNGDTSARETVHTFQHLFAPARSSPKRRITGRYIYQFFFLPVFSKASPRPAGRLVGRSCSGLSVI